MYNLLLLFIVINVAQCMNDLFAIFIRYPCDYTGPIYLDTNSDLIKQWNSVLHHHYASLFADSDKYSIILYNPGLAEASLVFHPDYRGHSRLNVEFIGKTSDGPNVPDWQLKGFNQTEIDCFIAIFRDTPPEGDVYAMYNRY